MTYEIEYVEKSFLKAFPLPSILQKIIAMMKDESKSLLKLGQEIAKDPILTAKIIATVNSPLYATKQKISDLPHAVSFLGYAEIAIIISRTLSQSMLFSSKKAAFSLLYYPRKNWLHSLRTAHIARILVRHYNLPFSLESYMAGLLHDIGKNALALTVLPAEEKQLIEGCAAGYDLYVLESQILGFSHQQLGFNILKQMGLSINILNMVLNHHSPQPADFNSMNFILALSNILAKFDNIERLHEINDSLNLLFNMNTTDIKSLSALYQELKIDMEFI